MIDMFTFDCMSHASMAFVMEHRFSGSIWSFKDPQQLYGHGL